MKRFAMMDQPDVAQGGLTAEEIESKRKARMERFGEAEVKESQEAAAFKLNRRKAKMLRKSGGKSLIVDNKKHNKKQQQNNRSSSSLGSSKQRNKFGQKRFKR